MQALKFCAALTAGALVACGGGGGGGGDGSTPPSPGTPQLPNTPSAAAGLASYSTLIATLDPASATRYTVQVDLAAFNAVTRDAASIASLRTTATNLLVPNGSQVLGEQRYTLQSVNCTQSAAAGTYSALMLFDRSGSMLTNDPADDTLAAAREFVNRMDANGQAWVAAFPGGFPGRPTSPVTFYGTNFTGSKAQLLADISAVGAPDGNTPLWDSMIQSIGKFPSTAPAPGTGRALLTFSDGQDNQSTGSPGTVQANAQQRGVKVFAINLRNTDSVSLDSIALATGGNVFSTDDAKKLVAFYGTLGKLLSGAARTCSVTMAIQFVPSAGAGEVGYGPGGSIKFGFEFDGTSGASDPVLIETQLALPFYPGRRIGQTAAGKGVFETDRADGTNCLTTTPDALINSCATPISMVICNAAAPTACSRSIVQAKDVAARRLAGVSTIAAECPWIEPFDKYDAVAVAGVAPTQLFTAWNAVASSYQCVNTARGPF